MDDATLAPLVTINQQSPRYAHARLFRPFNPFRSFLRASKKDGPRVRTLILFNVCVIRRLEQTRVGGGKGKKKKMNDAQRWRII